MKKNSHFRCFIVLIYISICCFIDLSILKADGKLLRGEKWTRFEVKDNKADFYVSPAGNDDWSGRLDYPNANKTDGPFRTIEKAQKAVVALKKSVFLPKEDPVEKRWIGSPHPFGKGKDILVLIREGHYPLNQPLLFEAKDGGERVETNLPSGAFEYHKLKDYYVTYAAYPGEIPILSGGEPIKNWKQNGNLWTTHLPTPEVQTLVANGKKLTLARTPNSGYFTPPKFSTTDQELYFNKGDLKQWKGIEDSRVTLLLRWHTGINSFSRIDEDNQIAYLKESQPGIQIIPPRFYIENVRELLDAPGEWYFDRKSKELHLFPPRDISNPNKTQVTNPTLNQLIILRGTPEKPVRNLRIYGIGFEATNSGGSCITLTYAHACEIVDSKLSALAGTGVLLEKGCYQSRILNNYFQSLDNGAVTVNGNAHPDNWTDIIRETNISFNKIENCGGTNILAQNTLFTTISRNVISNTRGRFAISVGGWSNLEEAIDGSYRVEYNHLYQVQKDADDSGVIKTAGLTFDSYVRYNLIHDVKAGYFNDNVGFWFDNMSSGWITENNIYYNLEQGEMKLCAANLVDNIYQDNFVIEPPEMSPEEIIEGEPQFEYTNLSLKADQAVSNQFLKTGDKITLSADVKNNGSSGIQSVPFYINGQIIQSRLFPVIHKNTRTISFTHQLSSPGILRYAIGSTPIQTVRIAGAVLSEIFTDLYISNTIIPYGDSVLIRAAVNNLATTNKTLDVPLYVNGRIFKTKTVQLKATQTEPVSFYLTPQTGSHRIRIGNSSEQILKVFSRNPVNLKSTLFSTYISATANPADIQMNQQQDFFKITASGSDFYHAEDSYATIYPQKKISGNFVASVKVKGFGDRTHEWFRAGIFARNQLNKSFDTEPGSLGSVLVFTSPARAGIQWDEFGDGCMHKADSENLPENVSFPIWLKLIRHGNSFSGAISYDGNAWENIKQTRAVPGLADEIDIGLAAGSCDRIPYWVEFEDFLIETEAGQSPENSPGKIELPPKPPGGSSERNSLGNEPPKGFWHPPPLPGEPSGSDIQYRADFPLKPPINGTIYVIAHRGAHQGIPENSLPAYQKAIEMGCDFVEVDVRTTRDGKFISCHNAAIDAYVEDVSGNVETFSLKELRSLDIGKKIGNQWIGTKIPTFEEILELCKGKIGIYLDLKSAPIPPLIDLIKEKGMESDIVWCLGSVSELAEVQEHCPDCVLMPDPGNPTEFEQVLAEFKPFVVAPVWREFCKQLVEMSHEAGAIVFVDEGGKDSWEQALKLGAKGIQTDYPAELITYLKSRK